MLKKKKKEKKVISVQKQQQLKGDLLRMGLLRAGERVRDLRQEKGSCWVLEKGHLWLLSTRTALHMRLKGKGALRPLQTQQPKATENTGWFQRQSWEKNHSIQSGVSPVNYS